MTYTLHHGDCLDVLKTLPDCSVDSVVTDPPYGLSFMGKRWDYDVPAIEIWAECLRVLKPGGHLLAFAGTRTQHRMAVRIEDAGFEIRDMIAWVYGSGFPKSLDVSKAFDKAVGHWRGRAGYAHDEDKKRSFGQHYKVTDKGEPITDAARQWQGWGTALKPALEPITVARKPLIGTVAENVLAHGTGGINVDGCRVEGEKNRRMCGTTHKSGETSIVLGARQETHVSAGRWPANLIHDGSEEVTDLLGEAARFFYCAKASKRDRDEGLKSDVAFSRQGNRPGSPDETGKFPDHDHSERAGNFHPTVKPTDLMRYLCRLVTPPGGIVLDAFMGSGSTGKAAILEGFQFIGIEREAEYIEIARARIEHAQKEKSGMLL